MLFTLRPPVLLLVAALSGCGSDADDREPGGQTGEESGGCAPERSNEPLGAGEVSPLGFSADELLATLGAERRQTLTWNDGTSTPVRLAILPSGLDVIFERVVDYECIPALQGYTGGALKVPVVFTLATEDGALNETWPLTLRSSTESTAFAGHPVDPEALQGSLRIERADDETISLSVDLSPTTWTGALAAHALRTGTIEGSDETFLEAGVRSIATF